MRATLDPPPHQSGLLQRLDVLGGAGESHVEGEGEFTDAALALGEALKNGAPRRVRQRVKDGIQICDLMFNHVV
jgi:hypothetical protein